MFINFIYVGLAFMIIWGLIELLEAVERLKELKQINGQLIDQLKKVNKELAQLDKRAYFETVQYWTKTIKYF